ncbi:MAG: type II toxin-antitoxin system Phd/YefM family antitoxin [Verrucomicrobiia bacterium]
MSDMKQVSAREFQKQFGQLAKALAEGQTVQVTHHGKPLGEFTKSSPRKVKTPNFIRNLRQSGCDPSVGDKILQEFDASLS